jgi:hypothetical protein
MIGVMAVLLLSNSSPAAADLTAAQLPEIFEAACLDGEAKLSPGTASPATFDALPSEVRHELGKPSSAKIWRLSGSGNAFLYLLDYEPAPNMNPRICGLASDQMDYGNAADAVEMRVTGRVSPKTMRTTEWLNPAGGYSALATRAGNFKVLQVNWLSDLQRAQIVKAQSAIP